MFKVEFVEMIARNLPETLLFFGGCYLLSKTKINFVRIFISALTLYISIYLIRMLPINVYTLPIFGICIIILSNIFVNKISIVKSISSAMHIVIIKMLSEAVNIKLVKSFLNINLEYVLENTQNEIIYSSSSLLIFMLFIIITHFFKNKVSIKTKKVNEEVSIFKY